MHNYFGNNNSIKCEYCYSFFHTDNSYKNHKGLHSINSSRKIPTFDPDYFYHIENKFKKKIPTDIIKKKFMNGTTKEEPVIENFKREILNRHIAPSLISEIRTKNDKNAIKKALGKRKRSDESNKLSTLSVPKINEGETYSMFDFVNNETDPFFGLSSPKRKDDDTNSLLDFITDETDPLSSLLSPKRNEEDTNLPYDFANYETNPLFSFDYLIPKNNVNMGEEKNTTEVENDTDSLFDLLNTVTPEEIEILNREILEKERLEEERLEKERLERKKIFKEKESERARKYYIKNKEKIRLQHKAYREKIKERLNTVATYENNRIRNEIPDNSSKSGSPRSGVLDGYYKKSTKKNYRRSIRRSNKKICRKSIKKSRRRSRRRISRISCRSIKKSRRRISRRSRRRISRRRI
jgi:hypothetical protein